MITAYAYDSKSLYAGAIEIDEFGPIASGLSFTAPPELTGAQVARWLGSEWEVLDSSPAEVIDSGAVALAIAQTYVDVDSIYQAAIGLRATEYSEAEAAARAYVAAGYTGPVSPYVSGYAANNPTGQAQSGAWAADGIIARADAFLAAQLAMRNMRMASQAQMRAATTPAELEAAIKIWKQFIAMLFSQLGL